MHRANESTSVVLALRLWWPVVMAWGSVGRYGGVARWRRDEVWSVSRILWDIESELTISVVLGHVGSPAVVVVLKNMGTFARGTV